MCFVKDFLPHKIANEDIRCYKVVRKYDNENYFRSSVFHYPYELGCTYFAKPPYYFRERCVDVLHFLDNLNVLSFSVFHSFIEIDELELAEIDIQNGSDGYRAKCVILECVIPAGTPYWVNAKSKQYASTSIKVVRSITTMEYASSVN